MTKPNDPLKLSLLPGVPETYVVDRLTKAAGKELSSGKFLSESSSAFLAANTFAWFHEQPERFPAFGSVKTGTWPASAVDIEYCARFPWPGGEHPWLDALVETDLDIVGIESKRFEPFRGTPKIYFSDAYDRDVWHDHMEPFKVVKDQLKSGELKFKYVNAAQLVKHAFGLITEGRKKNKSPYLIYLFAEPAQHAANWSAHREEIATLAQSVRDAEVGIAAISYRDWLATWSEDKELAEHRDNILKRFEP